MSEEERFRQAVPNSMHAVRAVQRHLISKGMLTRINEVKVRPCFEQRADYGDREDLFFRASVSVRWQRVEVKGRTIDFTCCEDFPFPTIIADRATKDSSPADWYVNVSRDLRYAAVMNGAKRSQWETREIFDTTKGYGGLVYLCPKIQAHFVVLIG